MFTITFEDGREAPYKASFIILWLTKPGIQPSLKVRPAEQKN